MCLRQFSSNTTASSSSNTTSNSSPPTPPPNHLSSTVVEMDPRCHSNTRFIGVRLRVVGHFAAEITTAGVHVWLGTINTKQEAAHAYNATAWSFACPRHQMNFPEVSPNPPTGPNRTTPQSSPNLLRSPRRPSAASLTQPCAASSLTQPWPQSSASLTSDEVQARAFSPRAGRRCIRPSSLHGRPAGEAAPATAVFTLGTKATALVRLRRRLPHLTQPLPQSSAAPPARSRTGRRRTSASKRGPFPPRGPRLLNIRSASVQARCKACQRGRPRPWPSPSVGWACRSGYRGRYQPPARAHRSWGRRRRRPSRFHRVVISAKTRKGSHQEDAVELGKLARCFPMHDLGQALLLPSSVDSPLRECIAAALLMPFLLCTVKCRGTVETRLGVGVCLLLLPTGAAARGHLSELLSPTTSPVSCCWFKAYWKRRCGV
nr:uncharacterized protein LOC127303978 [Lolium perenne]